MNISAEEKNRYLREAEVVLAREGFLTDRTHAGSLRVLFDGAPLCEVPESGGVTYRMADVSTPERIAAKDKVYSIVRAVAEYMYQMERAPILEVDGLEDSYKVLADFNSVVLAGCPSKYGTQFVTWDRDFDHKGVSHGHYYTGLYASGNYEAAKRDFATRSGLIPEQQVFREEQLIEIYRCCADTLQNDTALSYKREKTIQEVQEQIEQRLPSPQSELAAQTMKDPYIFDFIPFKADMVERDIEQALVKDVTKLLLELGTGFAFLGNQYHLNVGGDDFYIDLLFYNLNLRCYVVIELKTGEFKPEYAGQLNFYLSAVDGILKKEQDNPSIGLLLCKSKNDLVAEYSLKDMSKPIGVSAYQITSSLPEELERQLPSVEDIQKRIKGVKE